MVYHEYRISELIPSGEIFSAAIGYYDEAIFGNGHDEPHPEGIAVYSADGLLLYKNTECSLYGVECVNGDAGKIRFEYRDIPEYDY